MYKKYGIIFLVLFVFGFGFESLGKRKKKRSPKWSVSITNGYTFYSKKKKSSINASEFWDHLDGQMNTFFSSLDVGRNFGYYEIGGRIQFIGPTFISPYLRWNMISKNKKNILKPALTLGVVPSDLVGAYAKLSLGIAVNRYLVIHPFAGFYAWYKNKDNVEYERFNHHANGGLSLNLYF